MSEEIASDGLSEKSAESAVNVQEPAADPRFERGGFLARIMAFLLDLVIIIILQIGGLAIPLAALQQGELTIQAFLASFLVCATLVILSPLIVLFYFVLFHGSLGQTLGKMFMGLSVVSASGGRISFGIAFLRAIGFLLSALPGGAGLFWILVDSEVRGWHDFLAMTRVVQVNTGRGPVLCGCLEGRGRIS